MSVHYILFLNNIVILQPFGSSQQGCGKKRCWQFRVLNWNPLPYFVECVAVPRDGYSTHREKKFIFWLYECDCFCVCFANCLLSDCVCYSCCFLFCELSEPGMENGMTAVKAMNNKGCMKTAFAICLSSVSCEKCEQAFTICCQMVTYWFSKRSVYIMEKIIKMQYPLEMQ